MRVVVDRLSAPYLSEAKIDFVDSLEASGFTIDNPDGTELLRLRQLLPLAPSRLGSVGIPSSSGV